MKKRELENIECLYIGQTGMCWAENETGRNVCKIEGCTKREVL